MTSEERQTMVKDLAEKLTGHLDEAFKIATAGERLTRREVILFRLQFVVLLTMRAQPCECEGECECEEEQAAELQKLEELAQVILGPDTPR